MKETILDTLDFSKNWGELCNQLQKIALNNLSYASIGKYYLRSTDDSEQCEGCDGVLLNGQYFDWKTFEYRKRDIVSAYLDYFSDEDLEIIYNNL